MRVVATIVLALSAVFASTASATSEGPTSCSGTLLDATYHGVVVPAGASCTLLRVRVVGDVEAETGSFLNVVRSRVIGDVIGDHALIAQVNSGVVRGAVTITGAGDSPTGVSEVVVQDSRVTEGITVTDSSGTILIDRNNVLAGDIVVRNNYVPPFLAFPSQLSVRLNTVEEKVTVSLNAGPGPKEVHSNQVGGTLRCEQNESPFVGGPNDAGNTVGDCF